MPARSAVSMASDVGADTEAVLADILGLDQREIGRLDDAGVIAL